jgi:ribokinase
MDYIATVKRLPAAGETVPASTLVRQFGGKGANQAVAAARQAARVSMVGCVGADETGRAYRRRLRAEGINTHGLFTTGKVLTGSALIAVDDSAENLIIVVPGANGQLTASAIRSQRSRITRADILLLQFEVPMAAILEAVRLANRSGVPVVVNPSPVCNGFAWGKCKVNTLVVNAGEAQTIFNLQLARLAARVSVWRKALARKRISRLIVTRGSRPTICLTATEFFKVPTLPVKPVDTVGAGDAFAGALAARLAEGADLATAVRFANCAGALATLKAGAQEAIPTRAATDRLFKS